MDINELSIQEKIGQMLIIGMDTNYITDRIKTMITKYKIGGIILYRKNFNTYDKMLELIQQLKDLNKVNKIPLFIAIDQEGGRVNRMPKEIQNLPPANKIALQNDEELVKKSAGLTGKLLKNSGFNLNFAPVLDIKNFSNEHAIGDRCFGNDKETVAKYGVATMKSLQEQGIVSVIKHFPGHGATNKDSHYFLPIINKKIKNLENEDMYPFEQAINNGADCLLVGHLLIKNITGLYPASLSRKFISRYIRKKYKYNGLIFTDDLKMRAIRFLYGTTNSVVKAFKAGNDLIVFRFNKDEEKNAIEKVVKLTLSSKIKENRINRSVKRIINLKEKYNLSDNMPEETIDIDDFNNEILKIREKCGL